MIKANRIKTTVMAALLVLLLWSRGLHADEIIVLRRGQSGKCDAGGRRPIPQQPP